jgi:hypothetical protein
MWILLPFIAGLALAVAFSESVANFLWHFVA